MILGEAPLDSLGAESALAHFNETDLRFRFGGTDDADNSGILTHLSIRYAGNPLNSSLPSGGLVLAGVGQNTTLRHIEVFASQGHGLAIHGGNASIRNLVVAFADRAGTAADMGWHGTRATLAGNSGRRPGGKCHTPLRNRNQSSTLEFISLRKRCSSGCRQSFRNTDPPRMLDGTIVNSIFTDFKSKAIDIEDLPGTTPDAYANLSVEDHHNPK